MAYNAGAIIFFMQEISNLCHEKQKLATTDIFSAIPKTGTVSGVVYVEFAQFEQRSRRECGKHRKGALG
jgi:hypothetical protein